MKFYKKIYFLITIFLLSFVTAYSQVEVQNLETNEVSKTQEIKIDKSLVPIKEGTELKPIKSFAIEEIKLERKSAKNILISGDKEGNTQAKNKQNSTYVRPSLKKRVNRYVNNIAGTGLIGVGFSTVIGQINENPPEWERNTEGFFRRLGSNFGKRAISESVAFGMEEALKLDSRFYKSKKKDFGSRVKNAVLSSFTARTPSGKRVFNPSRLAGRYTANIIATETWYPQRFSYKDGLRQATRGVGFNIGFNIFREFVLPE